MSKKIFSFVALIALLTSISISYAQDKSADIIKKIASANQEYKSVISPFEQVKKMRGVKGEIVQKGVLYFNRTTQQLNMQYSQPKGDQLLITNDKLVLISKNSRTTYSTKSDANMKRLKWTLIYCIGGEIEKAAAQNGATINLLSDSDYYTFELTIGKQNKGGWSKLELSYSKKDYTLSLMKMIEKNGNYTLYKTPVKDLNRTLPEGVFNN